MARLLPLLAIVAVTVIDGRSRASDTSYVLIVHTSNPATELEREFVRDVFLKKTTEWGDGGPIRPVDLSSKYSTRDQFVREVIRKTPQQLKNYWNQQIFSGKGVPPPENDSIAGVSAYVASHPGAIGYIPADAELHGARVVRVK